MSRLRSLILITVDCLRADHCGFMGYPRSTMPFLDEMAVESLVFPNAIATGAPTYYSFPGILASRFPLGLGRDVVGIAPGEPTLATVLQMEGYRTAAFVAANPYLGRRFGYSQGFELYEDFLSEKSVRSGEDSAAQGFRPQSRLNRRIAQAAHALGPLGRVYDDMYFEYCQRLAASNHESWDSLRRFPAADVLVDRACDWLESIGDDPFFLWLHFMDPHAPYYPHTEALRELGAGHIQPAPGRYLNCAWNRGDLSPSRLSKYRDEIVLLYDAGIRWVDQQVSRLVTTLQRLSMWGSSVFALTADHGEEFLDHGGRFHLPSRAYQEIVHVPLILRVPGKRKALLSAAPFSHIHLAPTMLETIGIDPPAEFEGGSYWPGIEQGGRWETAISESVGKCTNPMESANRCGGRVLVAQDRRFKLVVDFDRNRDQLFDLENDPQELKSLPQEAEKPARARLLREALQHLDRTRQEKADLRIRARVQQIELEWSHSKVQIETLAS